MNEEEPKCPVCKGNNKDMPCAYPGENLPGCLIDSQAYAILEIILFEQE